MTYSEIVQALKDGEAVHWHNPMYKVSLNSAGSLHIRHLNGSGCTLIYFFGDDPSFYVEDGLPDLAVYKGQFLNYDAVACEWWAESVGAYPTLKELKYEIDCWLASIEMAEAEEDFYKEED